MRIYQAFARVYSGKFYVGEILTEYGDIHQIGGIRDFDSWEEADNVAKHLALGEWPDIRPAGRYVCNR
jgi:hypothetical protein